MFCGKHEVGKHFLIYDAHISYVYIYQIHMIRKNLKDYNKTFLQEGIFSDITLCITDEIVSVFLSIIPSTTYVLLVYTVNLLLVR